MTEPLQCPLCKKPIEEGVPIRLWCKRWYHERCYWIMVGDANLRAHGI